MSIVLPDHQIVSSPVNLEQTRHCLLTIPKGYLGSSNSRIRHFAQVQEGRTGELRMSNYMQKREWSFITMDIRESYKSAVNFVLGVHIGFTTGFGDECWKCVHQAAVGPHVLNDIARQAEGGHFSSLLTLTLGASGTFFSGFGKVCL